MASTTKLSLMAPIFLALGMLTLASAQGSTCDAGQAYGLRDAHHGYLSPLTPCLSGADCPEVEDWRCYPSVGDLNGPRGAIPTDYFFRLDSIELPGYPTLANYARPKVGSSVLKMVSDHLEANCDRGETSEEERLDSWLALMHGRCGISVTTSNVSGDLDFDTECEMTTETTSARCSSADIVAGSCDGEPVTCEQASSGMGVDLNTCTDADGNTISVSCLDPEVAMMEGSSSNPKSFRDPDTGLATDLYAYVTESDAAYTITGVGRMFCFDSKMVSWTDSSISHGAMDFFDIDITIAKGDMPDAFPAGAFDYAEGASEPFWISSVESVEGTLKVKCGVDLDDAGNIAPCDAEIRFVGEAHKEGECSFQPAGVCEDSLTFMKGLQVDYLAAYPDDEADVKAAFSGGMEVKNYGTGWVITTACSSPDSCEESATSKDIARDLTFITTDGCSDIDDLVISSGGGDVSDAPPDGTGVSNIEDEYMDTSSAEVVGDPHFVGFNGQSFDYSGRPGQAFNLLSTRSAQVNAALVPDLIHGMTYMGAVGILTPAARVAVIANADSQKLMIEVDDVLVDDTTDLRPGLSVKRVDAQTATVYIAGVLDITLTMRHNRFVDVANVTLNMAPTVDSIHGVLGQTALPGRELVGYEGAEEDYYVSSLYATDFMHNRYRATAGLDDTSATDRIASRWMRPFGGHHPSGAVVNMELVV